VIFIDLLIYLKKLNISIFEDLQKRLYGFILTKYGQKTLLYGVAIYFYATIAEMIS
jgi:hypothetical protein